MSNSYESIDVGQMYSADKKEAVTVSAVDRLSFAYRFLFALGGFCLIFFVWYGVDPSNDAVAKIFELIKIGALPLVTLVISFYFPNRTD
jgi:hypothetical protein